MPDSFFHRIKMMRIHQTIQLICLIMAMISCGVLIQCMLEGNIVLEVGLFLGIMAVVSISLLIYSRRYLKDRSGNFPFYRIPIAVETVDDIVKLLGAGEVAPNAFFSLFTCKNIKVRLLMLYCPVFSEEMVKKQRRTANKKINSLFSSPANEPYFEAVARHRINLVVCDNCNDELLAWVTRNPEHLMHRNESIMAAAVILQEKMLILPAFVSGDLDFKQLKKYEIACNTLSTQLSGVAD